MLLCKHAVKLSTLIVILTCYSDMFSTRLVYELNCKLNSIYNSGKSLVRNLIGNFVETSDFQNISKDFCSVWMLRSR